MKFRASAILLCLFIASNVGITHAQQPAASDDPTEFNRARSRSGLEQLVEEVSRLDNPVMRIYIGARLADIYRDRDRERTRGLMARAYADYGTLGTIDLFRGRTGTPRHQLLNRLTSGVIMDLEFARGLVLNMTETPARPGTMVLGQTPRAELLMELAMLQVHREPAIAADLARQSLSGGVPVNLSDLLDDLGRKDRRLADTLARDAITTILARDGNIVELGIVGSYVLRPDEEALGHEIDEDDRDERTKVNPELTVAYLEAVWTTADRYVSFVNQKSRPKVDADSLLLTVKYGYDYYRYIRHHAVAFEKYDPERAAPMRLLGERLGAMLDPKDREMAQTFSDPDTTAETLESRALRSDDVHERDHYLHHAISKAERAGNLEEALGYAEKIEHEHNRTFNISSIKQAMARRALGQGQIDEALKIAATIPRLDHRARTETSIAETVARAGDKARALELLDAAEQRLVKSPDIYPFDAGSTLENMVRLYNDLDSERAFEVAKDAVRAINAAAAIPVDERRRPHRGTPYSAMDFVNYLNLSQELAALSRVDFDRALALAREISDRPLSIVCQIDIYAVGLRGLPPRTKAAPVAGP